MGPKAEVYLDNIIQKITLKEIGVSEELVSKFFLGEFVTFEFISKSSGYVTGYITKVGDEVISHIFYIKDRSGNAIKSFLEFREKTFNIAKSFNVKDVELGGSTIIKDKILEIVQRMGFEKKIINVPKALGGKDGEKMEVYIKKFKIK